ncbi:MAG: sulfate adenylyltransferase subunit CysN [Spirochaetaceae bacterium]|nr:sulfate adenylyltransferase subunit CysN [Spirochaetaceae bacterium]
MNEAKDINELLEQNKSADLLRFTTAGRVDDGKSTLIGRLLHDSKNIYDDHLEAVGKDSKKLGREVVDYALLTDGLKAEREQGITIDVAYRYFSTPKRRFIIADTPGHVQYTRNMATGASTADLAIILVDARNGVLTQSKRHSFISALLSIPHIVIAINKMDLVDWSEERFNEIKETYLEFAAKLDMNDITFIPMSALEGDNVVNASENMKWYQGTTLMNHLETVYTGAGKNMVDFRFPVQYVNRPNLDFRGFCGMVASGAVRPGDEIMVVPSRKTSKVKSIVTMDGELEEAFLGMSVTITLEDEIDISRGDMIVHAKNVPYVEKEIESMIVWMNDNPMSSDKLYQIKHGTRYERARFTDVVYKVNPDSLHREDSDILNLNEIGRVSMHLFNAIPHDEYSRNRGTGGFIIIDPISNVTVGAGMIINRSKKNEIKADMVGLDSHKSQNIFPQAGDVSHIDRCNLLGQKPKTFWMTGLSGSGKSTIAFELEKEFFSTGRPCYVLDGDNVRHGLNRDLGFSAEDRKENIRRIAEVAKLMNDAGMHVITSFISPFREDRKDAREIIGDERFMEIFVDTPIEVCSNRDPKGLYKKAYAGDIQNFTGISSPYEAPENPDIIIKTVELEAKQAVELILREIKK